MKPLTQRSALCRITRVKNERAPWMVSFPTERSGKVHRIRKSFTSVERAREFAAETNAEIAQHGIRLGSLPPEVRRAYRYFLEASAALAAKGLAVPDFESFVRNGTKTLYDQANTLITVAEAIEQFLAYKTAAVTASTIQSLRLRLRLFARFLGDRQIQSITAEEIKAWLIELPRQRKPKAGQMEASSPSRLSALSINHYRSALSALFRHAERENWIAKNPITTVRPKAIERSNVPVPSAFGPADVVRIMHTALHYRPETVPVLALSMFAGLRLSEAARTDLSILFTQATMESGHFPLSRGLSKRSNRHIPVSDALRGWLGAQRRQVGSAWEGTQKELRAKILEVLTMSGAEPTIDSPRYTYIRYRLELTRDVLGLMLECGITLGLVQTLSRIPVSSEDANMFFSIIPSTTI